MYDHHRLPKRLHRWFVGYLRNRRWVEENFDSREDAKERCGELKSGQLFTRERALPESRLRK